MRVQVGCLSQAVLILHSLHFACSLSSSFSSSPSPQCGNVTSRACLSSSSWSYHEYQARYRSSRVCTSTNMASLTLPHLSIAAIAGSRSRKCVLGAVNSIGAVGTAVLSASNVECGAVPLHSQARYGHIQQLCHMDQLSAAPRPQRAASLQPHSAHAVLDRVFAAASAVFSHSVPAVAVLASVL